MNAPQLSTELRAARMAPLARLPVFMALDGKRALVAGCEPGVAWKVELLSAAGASVDVYAARSSAELRAAAADPPGGPIVLHERQWQADDLAGAALAVGGFDDEPQAASFTAAARAAGVPVNVIDKPSYCDFTFGAIVNRSPLVIGISTDGAAPVFAQAIRAKLETMVPRGFARWVEAASRWRERVKESGLAYSSRRRFWQAFTTLAVTHPNRSPRPSDLEQLLDQVRCSGREDGGGSVTVLAVDHDDPELLTLRAVRVLQSADVIVIDGAVATDILDFARRETRTIVLGQAGGGSRCQQQEIAALTTRLAAAGQRVVRLVGTISTSGGVDVVQHPR
jgi:uroporphyrin-III C-methyltransferase/precorrin-2 dehydrogenase/sirohydrochlorin ferrochelatase